MQWSGHQDAQGFELQNYRDETLAAKPAYSSPDDEGRKIFVDTPGADYGPWVGDEDSGDWIRPGAFGGSGAGYTEAGLLMLLDPRPMADFGAGFDPLDPAYVVVRRPLDTLEELYLQATCDDGGGGQAIVGNGNILSEIPWGPGTVTVYEVWWDSQGGLFPPFSTGYWNVNLLVVNTDTGDIVDVLTVAVNGAPL